MGHINWLFDYSDSENKLRLIFFLTTRTLGAQENDDRCERHKPDFVT